MSDLLNILSESNKDIDNQKLMDYISGRLSEEAKHEVEKWMIDNPFFDEAVQGLQQAGGEKKVQSSVDQINRQLAKYLEQKKTRKSKRKLSTNTWTYIAVVIILMLAVLVYVIVSKL
jgi:anti-sigma factor RsiW